MEATNSSWFSRLSDSFVDAMSKNFLKRVLYAILFSVLLGGKELIKQLDIAGQTGGGWKFLLAFWLAGKHGVKLAMGSAWNMIIQFYQNPPADVWVLVGSLGFSVLIIIALIGFWFQPVSLLINIFDMRKGQEVGKFTRAVATIFVVIGLSAVVYYGGDGEVLTSNLSEIQNETMVIPLVEEIEQGFDLLVDKIDTNSSEEVG